MRSVRRDKRLLVVSSVCPHESSWLLLDTFPLSLILVASVKTWSQTFNFGSHLAEVPDT